MLHVSIILTVFTTGSNDKFLKLWILLHFISYLAQSAMDETSDSGAFIRTASTFHNVVSQYLSRLFPAEVESIICMYHACLWTFRCLACLKIKGLAKPSVSWSANLLVCSKEVESKSYDQINTVCLLLNQLNPSGKEQRKLMSIWDGFFLLQVQRNQEL